jgi:predicted SprT family Zn-dependent metalloprotease
VKYKFGTTVKDHGAEWREAMTNCGIEPLRLHTVDRTGLARRQRLFILKDCPNEHQCRMSVREYNQVQRGAVMECKKCGLLVNLASPVEEDQNSTALQEL